MSEQNSSVIELAPQMGLQPVAPNPVNQAEVALIEATKKAALARFDSAFQLEAEVVGATRRTASKKGAVSLTLLPMRSKDGASMESVSGMKGEALKAYARMKGDELKGQQGVIASRLTGSLGYVGAGIKQSPKGDITMVWKAVEPITVTKTKAVSEDEALKALGIDPAKYALMKQDLAIDAPKSPESPAPSESETAPGEIKANGEVDEVKPAEVTE